MSTKYAILVFLQLLPIIRLVFMISIISQRRKYYLWSSSNTLFQVLLLVEPWLSHKHIIKITSIEQLKYAWQLP